DAQDAAAGDVSKALKTKVEEIMAATAKGQVSLADLKEAAGIMSSFGLYGVTVQAAIAKVKEVASQQTMANARLMAAALSDSKAPESLGAGVLATRSNPEEAELTRQMGRLQPSPKGPPRWYLDSLLGDGVQDDFPPQLRQDLQGLAAYTLPLYKGGAGIVLLDRSNSVIHSQLRGASEAAFLHVLGSMQLQSIDNEGYGFSDWSQGIKLSDRPADLALLRKLQQFLKSDAGQDNGSTNLSGALAGSIERIAREKSKSGKRLIVILTDGFTGDEKELRQFTGKAKASGIDVVAIGLDGSPVSRQIGALPPSISLMRAPEPRGTEIIGGKPVLRKIAVPGKGAAADREYALTAGGLHVKTAEDQWKRIMTPVEEIYAVVPHDGGLYAAGFHRGKQRLLEIDRDHKTKLVMEFNQPQKIDIASMGPGMLYAGQDYNYLVRINGKWTRPVPESDTPFLKMVEAADQNLVPPLLKLAVRRARSTVNTYGKGRGILLVDESGSMSSLRPAVAAAAADLYVEMGRYVMDRAAVGFSEKARHLLPFRIPTGKHARALIRMFGALAMGPDDGGGPTNMTRALSEAIAAISREKPAPEKRVIYVLTDGLPTDEGLPDMLRKARQAGIEIIGINVENGEVGPMRAAPQSPKAAQMVKVSPSDRLVPRYPR
ncbi:MAG: VWA domain-containing protein, partial [Elusimicrobia bacterium]|nr:VWA domain-containing protein [Elusimicrobiota bacterium]